MPVVDAREKLVGCVESICRLMYDPGLPVNLSQILSVSGRILWPTVTDGVRGKICNCIPIGI